MLVGAPGPRQLDRPGSRADLQIDAELRRSDARRSGVPEVPEGPHYPGRRASAVASAAAAWTRSWSLVIRIIAANQRGAIL